MGADRTVKANTTVGAGIAGDTLGAVTTVGAGIAGDTVGTGKIVGAGIAGDQARWRTCPTFASNARSYKIKDPRIL